MGRRDSAFNRRRGCRRRGLRSKAARCRAGRSRALRRCRGRRSSTTGASCLCRSCATGLRRSCRLRCAIALCCRSCGNRLDRSQMRLDHPPYQRHLLRRYRHSRKHLTQGQHHHRACNHMQAASHFPLFPQNALLHGLSGIVQTALDRSLAALGQTGDFPNPHLVHIVSYHRRFLQDRKPFDHITYNLYRLLAV